MKRILCLLLALCMMLPVVALAEGTVKVGQVQYAAHGSNAFAVMTVVLQDDVIIAAYIDEYQFTGEGEGIVTVPTGDNRENGMGAKFPEGQVLISKRTNNAYYSGNMAERGGAPQELATSYDAIQAFVVGKTIEELKAAVDGYTADNKADFIDVVSGSTLADTLGYVNGLIAAAKAAQ